MDVFLDHVDDRSSERVLTGTGLGLVAVVHAGRGEVTVDGRDLGPVGRQDVSDDGVRWPPRDRSLEAVGYGNRVECRLGIGTAMEPSHHPLVAVDAKAPGGEPERLSIGGC